MKNVMDVKIFDFTISRISKLTTINSQKVFMFEIPWQFQVTKNQEENSLGIFLQCLKEGDSSNWAVPGCFATYLLSSKAKASPLENHTAPFVFNPTSISFGLPAFIQWDDLLNAEHGYVKNDTIRLKIEMTIGNPDYPDRATLQFESQDTSRNRDSLAKFRLTVENVENLMAVHSKTFNLKHLPWGFTVYKEKEYSLGIVLEAKNARWKNPCEMTMSVKLLSTKSDIEKSCTQHFKEPATTEIEDVVEWDDLLDPEKGFVNDNSITLEVQVEAVEAAELERAQKRPHSPE